MTYPYHITGTTLSVFIDNTPYQTDRSNPNWDSIRDLLNDPATTSDQLINAIKPITHVAAVLQGTVNVSVYGGEVHVDGAPIHTYLAKRVLDIAAAGLDLDPWVKFVQNVYANPFTEARDELCLWLERAEMPITGEGNFLAYKVVNGEFFDRHTGTFSNKIGETVSMPREDCDNESRALCSKGLHFCSKDYLPFFGVYPADHVMVIRINPADVVSIPRNETAKGRAWRYEVVGEISREQAGIRDWLPIDTSWDTDEDFDLYEDDFDGDEDELFEDFDGQVVVQAPTVKTAAFGDLTFEKFVSLRANNGGTNASFAKAIVVPAGTVGKWAAKFRAQGCAA